MSLYNPNDRVIVRPDLQPGREYFMLDRKTRDAVTMDMAAMAGSVVTIKKVSSATGKYTVSEDPHNFWWTDDMFIPFQCADDFESSPDDFDTFLLISEGVFNE